ncbi:hypothetical protein [Candidatus Laterigemmans baculatus]|uniref:hypothetical protein n=1 Tax=Candidatus Laterigemmans baculatus TaxID=2770505 RepID=UPI001F1F9838|nr:hypothetical protein [Candidatus Laterigemmans baculatus]
MHSMPASTTPASPLPANPLPPSPLSPNCDSAIPAAEPDALGLGAGSGGDPPSFVERRQNHQPSPAGERRQFASSHQGLSPAARELALAIDRYKLEHRRRYVTFEEMLQVISALGYQKPEGQSPAS